MRQHRRSVHKHIVCDEATPEMVLAQKKLFQSPSCMLQLGASQTHCHAYDVFVSGTGFIVCSNTWMEQVELLLLADEGWMPSNSIPVHVEEPLYMHPGSAQGSSQ